MAQVTGKVNTMGTKLFNLILKNLHYSDGMCNKGVECHGQKSKKLEQKLFEIKKYYGDICNTRPLAPANDQFERDDYLNRLVK